MRQLYFALCYFYLTGKPYSLTIFVTTAKNQQENHANAEAVLGKPQQTLHQKSPPAIITQLRSVLLTGQPALADLASQIENNYKPNYSNAVAMRLSDIDSS